MSAVAFDYKLALQKFGQVPMVQLGENKPAIYAIRAIFKGLEATVEIHHPLTIDTVVVCEECFRISGMKEYPCKTLVKIKQAWDKVADEIGTN